MEELTLEQRLEKLKSMAYDLMAQLEFVQGRFKQVNDEITKLSKQKEDMEAQENKPKEVKKESNPKK